MTPLDFALYCLASVGAIYLFVVIVLALAIMAHFMEQPK